MSPSVTFAKKRFSASESADQRMMWKYGSSYPTLWLSGTKWWWESLALHTPHCDCHAGTPVTTKIARDCCFFRVFSNCKRCLVPNFLNFCVCITWMEQLFFFFFNDGRQVVTVRSQGTDELLMQCTNGWSVGADDAVPRQVSIFRRQWDPEVLPLLPVCSGPRSRRQKWGCQDPHVVIHYMVLSGFAITSTLFMPDKHMMLVFITNH